MTTLGARLAHARRLKGLTQTELAVALGDRYSQSMISQVERGKSSLLVDGLIGAAQELDVSVDYLLGLTDSPNPWSMPLEVLGYRLASARNSKGMTLDELAASLGDGYDEGLLARVEANTASLPVAGLVKAVRQLNVSADYLLGFTDDPDAPAQIAPELAQVVFIPGEEDYAGWDGDVEFVETPFPFSTQSLAERVLDHTETRIFHVVHSSVVPIIPDDAYILVDYTRREPNDTDIFLIRQHRSLELGWFRIHGRVSFWNNRRRDSGRRTRTNRGLNVIGIVCWTSKFLDRGDTYIGAPVDEA